MTPTITVDDVRAALLRHMLPGQAVQAERAIRQAALKRMWDEAEEAVARLNDECGAALAMAGQLGRYAALHRKRLAAERRARALFEALNATWRESDDAAQVRDWPRDGR